MFCSLAVDSVLFGTQGISATPSKLTRMATPSFRMVTVLSVADRTVDRPVVRGDTIHLFSVALSCKVLLYSMSGSVVSLFAQCTDRSGRQVYSSSLGCNSTQKLDLLIRILLVPHLCRN